MIDMVEIYVALSPASLHFTLLPFSTPLGVGYLTAQNSSEAYGGTKPAPSPTYAATGVQWS